MHFCHRYVKEYYNALEFITKGTVIVSLSEYAYFI